MESSDPESLRGAVRDLARVTPMIRLVASRISSRTFVGRADERRALSEALSATIAGGAGTVLIAGEAGSGKTRLVGELKAMAGDAGTAFALGGCVAVGDGSLPFAPVAAAMHQLTRGLDDATLRNVLGRGARDLVRILPGLADRLSGLEAASSQAWIRSGLFEAVIGSLEALAARTPIVLVFEDLHWSDAASRDLIAFLVRSPRRAGTLVVATYRSDDVHRRHPLLPWLAEVGRTDGIDRIELTRFTDREVAAQMTGILDGDPPSGLVAAIERRSSGNPFLVEELVAAHVRGDNGDVPAPLRDVLLGRLAAISDGARSVVETASVAAQPIAPETIASVLCTPMSPIEGWLREAVEANVLTVANDVTGSLEFRHALVQEAVYGALLPGERRRLHLVFATSLEELGEPELALRAGWWGERAHHASAANDLSAALSASVAAGRAAAESGAFETAQTHFERAIELRDAVPDAPAVIAEDRVELLELASEAAMHAGADGRSLDLRRAALAALTPADPPTRRAAILLGVSDLAEYEVALAATTEAYALVADGPASALRARAEGTLARELSATQHWPEALAMSTTAVATAGAVGDQPAEGLARVRLARALAAVGRPQEAYEESERALELARTTRNRSIVGTVFALAARVHEGEGDARGSAVILDEGGALADDLGIRVMDFEVGRAWNHFQIGNWSATNQLLAAHARMAPLIDHRFHPLSALVDARSGMFEAAHVHCDTFVNLVSSTHSVVRAECALWLERPTEAAEHAREGLAADDWPYAFESWKGWLLRILARAEADLAIRARRRRRQVEAADATARAEDAAGRLEAIIAGGMTYRDLHGGELAASLALGRAEGSRAAAAPDPERWAAAAVEWDELGRPFEVAYARWREAEALLAMGRPRAEAGARLEEATQIAVQLGAAPLIAAAQQLASRARIHLPEKRAAHEPGAASVSARRTIGDTLTAREREVLALLCRGATNRQIAGDLFISESTAGVHVSNILGKLDVGSRTEAVAVAHMAGLVASPPLGSLRR